MARLSLSGQRRRRDSPRSGSSRAPCGWSACWRSSRRWRSRGGQRSIGLWLFGREPGRWPSRRWRSRGLCSHRDGGLPRPRWCALLSGWSGRAQRCAPSPAALRGRVAQHRQRRSAVQRHRVGHRRCLAGAPGGPPTWRASRPRKRRRPLRIPSLSPSTEQRPTGGKYYRAGAVLRSVVSPGVRRGGEAARLAADLGGLSGVVVQGPDVRTNGPRGTRASGLS